MICDICKELTDSGEKGSTHVPGGCKGGSWCDCQHRDDMPKVELKEGEGNR